MQQLGPPPAGQEVLKRNAEAALMQKVTENACMMATNDEEDSLTDPDMPALEEVKQAPTPVDFTKRADELAALPYVNPYEDPGI